VAGSGTAMREMVAESTPVVRFKMLLETRFWRKEKPNFEYWRKFAS